MEYLFYLGRILYGGFFIQASMAHFLKTEQLASYAASKGVPMPKLAVILSGLLIFFGGLWIVTGVYVQIGVAEIVLFLLGVTFTMHRYWEDTDPMQKMSNRINFMKNLALLGATLILLQIPPTAPFWGWSPF